MAAPVFVNHSALEGAVSGTTRAPLLPGSRVGGNILVGFLQVNAANPPSVHYNWSALTGSGGSTSFAPTLPNSVTTDDICVAWVSVYGNVSIAVSGAGWTLGDSVQRANISSAWAWAYRRDISAAPTFSWTGTLAVHGQIASLHGVALNGAIGNSNKADGVGTSLTAAALAAQAPGSFMLAILSADGNNAVPEPTNWARRGQFNDGTGASAMATQEVVSAGDSSDAISVTLPGSTDWNSFVIEVKAEIGSRPVWRDGGRVWGQPHSATWFWRMIDGLEGAPRLTWNTSGGNHAEIYQISGVSRNFPVRSPIGNKNSAFAAASTTITADALLLQGAAGDSLAVAMLLNSGNNLAPLPDGFTNVDNFNDTTASDRVCWQNPAVQSNAISETVGSSNWVSFVFELLTPVLLDSLGPPAVFSGQQFEYSSDLLE